MTSIIIFEVVALILLSAMLASRVLFRQPLDRIRIVQIGFGCIAVAAVCIGCGIGPTWTIALPHVAGTPAIEVGNRPPGDCVGDSRLGANTTDSSAEYRTLPPGGRQPTVEEMERSAMTESSAPLVAEGHTNSAPLYPYTDEFDKGIMAQNEEEPVLLRAHLPVENSLIETESSANNAPPRAGDASPPVLGTAKLTGILAYAALALFFLPPLFLFIRDALAQRRLRKILRNSTEPSESVLALCRKICTTNVRLRISHEIASPMVFGFLRPTLLLPATQSPALLQACLAHEWSHLKNGDLITWNIVRLFQYPLWLQPVYWMLRSRLLTDQDYLADDDGVQACKENFDYVRLLMDIAKTRRSAAEPRTLGMAGRRSQLRRRIDMLVNQPRPTHTSSKRKLLFPLVLFLALTLLGGLRFGDAQETADGRPQTAAEEQSPQRKQGTEDEDKVIVKFLAVDEESKQYILDTIDRLSPMMQINTVHIEQDGKMISVVGRKADSNKVVQAMLPQIQMADKESETEPPKTPVPLYPSANTFNTFDKAIRAQVSPLEVTISTVCIPSVFL